MVKFKLIFLSFFIMTALNAHAQKNADNTKPATSESFGISECDQFIERFQTCIDKNLTGEEREIIQASFDDMRKGMHEARAAINNDEQMAQACVQAGEIIQEQLKTYNCKF